ncbi:hypothetical protein JTE90_025562 [Oedothorax gibbosus]|uniref:Uncharacterized protein n=1 Tax=Oedothorax gibbosus TaxID=931172 RepID=A0AAV6TWG4_9ARAC|nr:hypothetical protein JTE90_025562 [Oedothorax gibbosus]
MKKMKILCPKVAAWSEYFVQLKYHCVFQSWGEPLELLEWLFGIPFQPRNVWGRYPSNAQVVVAEAVTTFEGYRHWAKPQRGAPRNIEGERVNQKEDETLKGAWDLAREKKENFGVQDEVLISSKGLLLTGAVSSDLTSASSLWLDVGGNVQLFNSELWCVEVVVHCKSQLKSV